MTCIQSWSVAQVSDHSDCGREGQVSPGSMGWMEVGGCMGDLEFIMTRERLPRHTAKRPF